MDSQECKEILSEEYDTESKEWKRVSKKKINGHTVRVFTHPEQEGEVWFVTDEDDSEMDFIAQLGKNGHILLIDEDDTLDEDGMGSFFIVDKDFYDREDCVNSVHLQHLLEIKYGIPVRTIQRWVKKYR